MLAYIETLIYLLKTKTMKKFTTLIIILNFCISLFAQPPEGFNYQAVVRDASGNIFVNQPVDFRLSIHENSISGNIIYQETQSVTTDDFGSVSLVVGEGTTVDVFEDINWKSGEKFIEVEVDLTGTYIPMGTSKLFSVPFAMYAGSDWNKNGNDLYYNNGNIGIGTDSPSSNLHISDPVNSTTFTLESQNFTTFRLKSLSSDYSLTGDDYSGILRLRNNNTNDYNLVVNSDGNVGIGHYIPPTGPLYKLEVLGDINYTGNLYQNGSLFSGSIWNNNGGDIYYNNGNVGIGTSSPSSNLHIYDPIYSTTFTIESQNFTTFRLKSLTSDYSFIGDDYSGILRLRNNSTNNYNIVVNSNGNVGIGHYVPPSGPFYNFEVLGDINYTGNLYHNGSLVKEGLWSESGTNVYYNGGNVGIGTTSPGQKLQVNGKIASEASNIYMHRSSSGNYGSASGFLFGYTTGSIGVIIESGYSESGGFQANGDNANIWSPGDQDLLRLYDEDGMVLKWKVDGNGTASTVSDISKKENIRLITDGLDKILSIEGITYNLIRHPEEMEKGYIAYSQAGVSAQQVENIIPEVVTTDDKGNKYVSYDTFIPYLIEAVKDQQKIIEELKQDIKELKENDN